MASVKKRPSTEDVHVVPNKTWRRARESTSSFNFEFCSDEDDLISDEESASELFQTTRNEKETGEISINTRTSSATNVLLCSIKSFCDAKDLPGRHKIDIEPQNILICSDKGIFSNREILSPQNKKMYMLVDSSVCDVLMDKRRLHDCVDDFFEEFAAAASKVCLLNRLPPSEQWRYLGLKFQLPQECITEYVEIELTTAEGLMEKRNQSQSDSDITQEESISNSDSDDSQENMTVPTSGDTQQNGSISDVVHCVQIGHKCSMNIEKPLNQRIMIRQDGVDNIVNVKIVPSPSVSKVVVVVTTDPENPELESMLHHEIDKNLQVINLKMKNVHEASIVDKRKGSIILEIEAKPGVKLNYNWIKNVVETIFIEKLQSRIDPKSRLKLDVEGTFTIPLRESGAFLMENDIHKNCVSKEKFDAKQRELDKLKEELTCIRKTQSDCVTKEKYEVVSRELDKLKHSLADQKQLQGDDVKLPYEVSSPLAKLKQSFADLEQQQGDGTNLPGDEPRTKLLQSNIETSKKLVRVTALKYDERGIVNTVNTLMPWSRSGPRKSSL